VNVAAIRNEIVDRLRTVVNDAYPELPSAPVFPCAIVGFPIVESFHTDMAHSITRVSVTLRVYVGKGDLNDTQDQLGQFLSTDTDSSVLAALELPAKTDAWIRLKVVRTSELLTETDALGVMFTIEIDA
jgi:hypothetical protein